MSMLSEIIRIGFTIFKVKDKTAKMFYDRPRNTGELNKEKFDKNLDIEEYEVDKFKVLTIKNDNSLNRHVIFLHGGAYVLEGIKFHRTLIEKLVKDYKLKVSYIDYPLAPEYTCDKTVDVVFKAYSEITKKNKGDEFYLFGDSAGGGLEVTLMQVLKEKNFMPFPKKSVLFCPWVDLSMSNPKIKEFEKKDPMLQLEGVMYAAKLYAGKRDLKDPLVSPTYGDLNNLGDILLFAATHEILNPDEFLLKSKLEKAKGNNVKFILGNKMVHDWIIGSTREAKEAGDEVGRFYISD